MNSLMSSHFCARELISSVRLSVSQAGGKHLIGQTVNSWKCMEIAGMCNVPSTKQKLQITGLQHMPKHNQLAVVACRIGAESLSKP